MTNQGWISLHRKSLDSAVFHNKNAWRVWTWCLLKANHQDNVFPFNGKDILIKKGSFITGVEKGSQQTDLTKQQWRTSMGYLKSTNRITTKSTNLFTIVAICKWNEYQQDNIQNNKPITNQQQTNNKPITTNNNDNNVNNDKYTQELRECLDIFSTTYKTTYKAIDPLIGNFVYWRKTYSLEEIKQAIKKAPQHEYWGEIMRPVLLFRRYDKAKNPVDYIGELLNVKKKGYIKL